MKVLGIRKLEDIEITDDDIKWVELAMGGKIHFDKPRINVIKNLDSVDIQAFPGSGKTTILVAKLAILAKKWPYSNSGICVLSHTNVAREEIQDRLGNSEVGRKLLSYPHFIGTVHSFFDTYIVLPWLRSNGYKINIIDTDFVRTYRWNLLPYNTRAYLQRQHKNELICEYKETIGSIEWKKNGDTQEKILSIIGKTQQEGYFTFGEMLLYAKQALEVRKEISASIQHRFPILFIDEAQDTDAFQWELLKKAFCDDGVKSIRQGYGDSNQAIYSNLIADDELRNFPRENALVLSESRRFDSSIAKLANTVALSKAQMGGTENNFSSKSINHTVFLFKKEKASQVIDEFGQLILDTFTDEEICKYEKEGCHVVGMVHDKKEETSEKQFPKGIYDYWNSYEAKKTNKRVVHQYLIEYFRIGINEFENTGEKAIQVEWICKGIRRLINKAKECNYIAATKNTLAALLDFLIEEEKSVFRNGLMELTKFQGEIGKDEWRTIVLILKQILKLYNITSYEKIKKFGQWKKGEETQNVLDDESDIKLLPNHYLYKNLQTNRFVDIEFGSIHSVKGRTHLATLVVETYLRTHNMKSILKYLCGMPSKGNPANEKRLKCQYVAMTRARALICLAIPIDFVDNKMQKKLTQLGWSLKVVE